MSNPKQIPNPKLQILVRDKQVKLRFEAWDLFGISLGFGICRLELPRVRFAAQGLTKEGEKCYLFDR